MKQIKRELVTFISLDNNCGTSGCKDWGIVDSEDHSADLGKVFWSENQDLWIFSPHFAAEFCLEELGEIFEFMRDRYDYSDFK